MSSCCTLLPHIPDSFHHDMCSFKQEKSQKPSIKANQMLINLEISDYIRLFFIIFPVMIDRPLFKCVSSLSPSVSQRVCVILPFASQEAAECVDCVFRELLTQYTPQTPWQPGLLFLLHITMVTLMFIKFHPLFEDIKKF